MATGSPQPSCLAVVALVLLSLSACGGGAQRQAEGLEETGVGQPNGRSVFLSQCQGCHALGKLGSRRPVGGDLTNYDMRAGEVRSFARIMPTPRPLSGSELAAVSEFVASVQRRDPRGPEAPAKRAGPKRGSEEGPSAHVSGMTE
jgi:mono/diheme cytochrome c family protein